MVSDEFDFNPSGECNSVFVSGTDVNNDGMLEPCTAVNGSIQCAFNTSSGGTLSFDSACETGTYAGDAVGAEGCTGAGCKTLQMMTTDESSNYAFGDTGYTCADDNVTAIRTTHGPVGSTIIAGSGGDFNRDGFWDYVNLFFDSTAGICCLGFYFGDASGDAVPTCGALVDQVAVCRGILVELSLIHI